MAAETFIIQSPAMMQRLVTYLARQRDFSVPWRIEIEQCLEVAGQDQEAVLRGKESKIARHTGYGAEEIHEIMLSEHYGTEKIEVGGHIWERPRRRTRTGPNKLNREEMKEHIRFVESFAATQLELVV